MDAEVRGHANDAYRTLIPETVWSRRFVDEDNYALHAGLLEQDSLAPSSPTVDGE